MRRYFTLSLCCFFLVTTMGCVGHKAPVQPLCQLAACKQTCFEHYKSCRQDCHKDCRHCQRYANCSADRHYAQYVHDQRVRGLQVIRELKSYRDPLQCSKTTCNCYADYNVCTQSCEGLIHKSLQVAPICC